MSTPSSYKMLRNSSGPRPNDDFYVPHSTRLNVPETQLDHFAPPRQDTSHARLLGTPATDGAVMQPRGSGWATQDGYFESLSSYHSTTAAHIVNSAATLPDPAGFADHGMLFPHGAPLLSHYDTLPSPQHYHHLSPASTYSSPNSSPDVHDDLFTAYANCPQNGSYEQPGFPGPAPHITHPSHDASTFANPPSHLPYSAATVVRPSNMPQPPTPHAGHAHTMGRRCEWDGCDHVLSEDSCAGVRRHLKDHHFGGNAPAAKTLMSCLWGGNCRRDNMQWENIPKHIAECHTKAMARTCSQCGDSFARSDTLKRHRESGNCTRVPRQM